MKLNIEELVRQTFTKQDAEALLEFQSGSLEDLVGLIVERCAAALDSTGNDHCAAAIRNLMED